MKSNIKTAFLLIVIMAGVSSCSSPSPTYKIVGNTNTLNDLKNLHAVPKSGRTKEMNAVRSQAIQDIALSVGAQAGLAWRSQRLNAILEKNMLLLDQAFDFNLLLLPHHIVPPVLSLGDNDFNLDDP